MTEPTKGVLRSSDLPKLIVDPAKVIKPLAKPVGLVGGLAKLLEPDQDGFNFWTATPIGWETRAAKDMLRNGHALLHRSADLEEFNSITVLLSTGVEKLLRVALGHQRLAEGKGWPEDLQETYRHKINLMNSELLKTAKVSPACTPEHLALIESTENDPVWISLLNVLHVYANEGRFYFQDQLAKRTPRADHDPMTGWLDLMSVVDGQLENARLPGDEIDLPQIRDRIEASLLTWWAMLAMIARDGLLGRPRAVKWGKGIDPVTVISG